MREAAFYEKLAADHVRCRLCPHECDIAAHHHGVCGVRYNAAGTLYTLVYDKVISHAVDPIEKKPLFHFQPGSTSYSIATVGCNMRCLHCQNWEISQWSKEMKHWPAAPNAMCPDLASLDHAVPGEPVSPEKIVAVAQHSRTRSISYTYSEPTIFFELAYDTAVLARQAGLKNVFVTNGYTSPAAVRQLAGVLDAANVDLKFWNDNTHRHITGAPLAPVLDSIRLYHELGVWIEVTTLVIPGLNDADTDLRGIAGFLQSVSPDIPWHISAFHPTYKMKDRPRTPATTLHRARQLGLEAGLRYVYEGNVPGQGNETTYCPACRKALIERYGFMVLRNLVRAGRCPNCGTAIAGVELSGGQ